ncbi:MAG: TetR/AcrR family transcriptional regulator [Blautia sp.]|jgi:AcrR family transcriptional regulator
MNTKEQIIEEALNLFSQKGYDAVSVRHIAKAVGIKESSLYYHFKNKQEIFDTIVDFCFQKAEEYFRRQALPFEKGDDLSRFCTTDPEELTDLLFTTFRYFFEDPYNVRFRKLLILSQYGSQKIQTIYRHLYREYPIRLQSHIFQMLMDAGLFRKENPHAVAMEFYSVVYLLIHSSDNFQEAVPYLKEHIHQLLKNYQI